MYKLYSIPGKCSTAITILLKKLEQPVEIISRDDVPDYQVHINSNEGEWDRFVSSAVIIGFIDLFSQALILLFLISHSIVTRCATKNEKIML